MLKFSTGYDPKLEANRIVFVLSEGNLKLLTEKKPIFINGDELKLDNSKFIIIWSANQSEISNEISLIIDKLGSKDQTVLHIDNTFYVLPLVRDEEILWIIGLDDVSFDKLRSNSVLHFRARGDFSPIDLSIIWGETEEKMMELLV